jgi:sulfonate transport system substrate-binding protein
MRNVAPFRLGRPPEGGRRSGGRYRGQLPGGARTGGGRPGTHLPGTRIGAGAVAAGLLFFGVTACSSSNSGSPSGSDASATTSASNVNVSGVTLNIGDQAGAGAQALLTAAGLINKLPFKAHWSDFTSGPPMLQAMGSGSVDIGEVGDAPPVFEASAGGQIALVSALGADINGSALLVPDNSPIKTVAQLKGKTVAVSQGSSANYHLLATLTKAGLTIKDITPDYLQPAEAEAAFASGHVDAWDIWSPYIEYAEAKYHARVIANGSTTGTTYSFVVASRSALADPAKAAAIRDYLKLYDEAYTWVSSHPSAWAASWAKATGMPTSVMLQAVKDDEDAPTPITPAVISSEQSVANAFSSAGLIPSKVDISDYAVTTFNSLLSGSSS